jgi:hypothetical protein
MSVFEADVLRSSNTGHPPSVGEWTTTEQQPGMNVFAMVMLSRVELSGDGGSAAAGIDWYERWTSDGQVERIEPQFWVRASCVFIEGLHRVHFILVADRARAVAVASLSRV